MENTGYIAYMMTFLYLAQNGRVYSLTEQSQTADEWTDELNEDVQAGSI